MRVKFLGIVGGWRNVTDSARTTINMNEGTKEPSSDWKRRILLAEHSPIRQLFVRVKWYDLKYWVSTHFVRHKFGIEHWIRTQRSDRTGINRDELPQGNMVEHEIMANAQAMINISRKRLCMQASQETREAWINVLLSIQDKEPELYKACVPNCIYQGHCYEYKSCGHHKTDHYKITLEEYRKNIN